VDADHFDQVFDIQPVTAVADIVAVHATGIGHGLLMAVGALHLPWFVKVFEITAADETAGRGGGHDVGVL
jgi:hypothetical protein